MCVSAITPKRSGVASAGNNPSAVLGSVIEAAATNAERW
jgi:hypothetical protein